MLLSTEELEEGEKYGVLPVVDPSRGEIEGVDVNGQDG